MAHKNIALAFLPLLKHHNQELADLVGCTEGSLWDFSLYFSLRAFSNPALSYRQDLERTFLHQSIVLAGILAICIKPLMGASKTKTIQLAISCVREPPSEIW